MDIHQKDGVAPQNSLFDDFLKDMGLPADRKTAVSVDIGSQAYVQIRPIPQAIHMFSRYDGTALLVHAAFLPLAMVACCSHLC